MSKKIVDYVAPSNDEMCQLREALGFTANQMAGLAVLDVRHFRRIIHNDADKARDIGFTNLFHMAAVLELTPAQLERVYNRMREFGAEFDQETVQVGRADRQ